MFKNRFVIIVLLSSFFSCNQKGDFNISIKGGDSVSVNVGTSISDTLVFENGTTDTIIFDDYRVSCECTLLEEFIKPYYLPPLTKKYIPFVIKTDSNDAMKEKRITFTFRTRKEPFFYSQKMIFNVK